MGADSPVFVLLAKLNVLLAERIQTEFNYLTLENTVRRECSCVRKTRAILRVNEAYLAFKENIRRKLQQRNTGLSLQ